MNQTTNRHIRVFISSTFQDLREEREYLIKIIIPQLQVEASKRDVTLTFVDLRWGITDEEVQNGKVLEICLNEIENCHPFFVGIIGDRYGWCPTTNDVNNNLIQRWGKWLLDDIEKELSITEIEMQHGALRVQDSIDASFFIKSTINTSKSDNPVKLKKLIDTIRNSHKYPFYSYDNKEQLGELVKERFTTILNHRFPIKSYSSIDKIGISQLEFAHSRTETFIKDKNAFNVINNFVSNDENKELYILGESGSGKSALIANWINESFPCENVDILYHYIGTSFERIDSYALLSILIEQIKNKNDISGLIDETKNINEQFKCAIQSVSSDKTLVIVLDALDQLFNIEDKSFMGSLPWGINNVKYIITSTYDNNINEIALARKGLIYEMPDTNSQGKKAFIELYLNKYGKSIEQEFLEQITNSDISNNYLRLKVLLDLLIHYGDHDNLNKVLDVFLTCPTKDFYQNVLSVYEDTFTRDLVSHCFSLLCFSRSGLQEDELQEMLEINQLKWSELYCSIHGHLVSVGGLLTFSHKNIFEAAKLRYIEYEERTHKEIIRYFGQDKTKRSMYEIPHHLMCTKEHFVLYKLLEIPDILLYHLKSDQPTLATYIKYLLDVDSQKYSINSLIPDFDKAIKYVSNPKEFYHGLGYFITTFFGDYNQGFICYENSLRFKDDENQLNDATTYNNIAYIYGQNGWYEKSIEFGQKALYIRTAELGNDHALVAQSLSVVGYAYDKLNDFPKAMDCFQKCLSIHLSQKENISDILVANDYNNIGHVFVNMGNLTRGLEFSQLAFELRRRNLGEMDFDTAMSYHNIGAIYSKMDRKQEAETYLEKAKTIWTDILGPNHPQIAIALFDLGVLYSETGKIELAIECMEAALNIREQKLSHLHPDFIGCLNQLSEITYNSNNHIKSVKYNELLYTLLKENADLIDKNRYGQITVGQRLYNSYLLISDYDYEKGLTTLSEIICTCEKYIPQNDTLILNLKMTKKMLEDKRTQGLSPTQPLKIQINQSHSTSNKSETNDSSVDTGENRFAKWIKALFFK